MKRVYILPNLVTTANIVCGFLSMIHAFKGDYYRACWFIIVGAICDSLDGRIARFARATSAFGLEYDSLSDLTSFGIAPAILLFAFSLHVNQPFGTGLATIYVVCAALRLARFNVGADEPGPSQLKKIRKGYFQGLPSPASAGLIVTMVMMQLEFHFVSDPTMEVVSGILSVGLGLLMVSNIPFPSFKEFNWRAKGKLWVLLGVGLFILFVVQAPTITLFSVGYSYLVLALGWSLYLLTTRDKNQRGGPHAGEV